MNIKIREYNEKDTDAVKEIWNQVVEDGAAFPQEEDLLELVWWRAASVCQTVLMKILYYFTTRFDCEKIQ